MHAIAEIIRLSPVIFGLVSVINNLLLVGGCILVTSALFRLKPRNPAVTPVLCGVIAAAVGAFRPYAATHEPYWLMNLFSTLLLLLPFDCMAIVFPPKGLWKSMLVVATVSVFMISLGLLSRDYTQSNQAAFVFMLLNIPLLTVTATFGMGMILKARASSEVYRAQLDMQVRHYEFMARMNDDLRSFRHDFPKKSGP